MTSALQDLLERHVASGTVPGVVASLGTAELEIVAAGAMSVCGAPMRADAIIRMIRAILHGERAVEIPVRVRGVAPGPRLGTASVRPLLVPGP